MANLDQAFEAIGGFDVKVDENTDGPFYTGGPNNPTGLNLPERTIYIQNTVSGFVIWKKFGNGINDWRIFDTTDIPFDPTGLSNFEPTDINADLALQRLGDQTLETSSQYQEFFDPSTSSTTSNGWVNKLQLSTDVLNTGYYILQFTGDVTLSKSGKKTGFRVRWREDGVTGFATIHETLNGVSVPNEYETRSGFSEIPVTGNNTVTVQFQFGQTTETGTASLKNVGYYIFKVRDL